MAYTTPSTWVAGNVLTAAQLNQQVRDNVSFLAGTKGAEIVTSQTTASTSYTDLATAGPAVSTLTGTTALVLLSALLLNNTSTNLCYMGFAISGATTVAAGDEDALIYQAFANNGQAQMGTVVLVTGLTAGTNTFTAKYRVNGGTGTFQRRRIAVIPLV